MNVIKDIAGYIMDAKFWRSIRAKLERWHPLVISAAIICIAVKLHDTYPTPNLSKEVLVATINISTINIGFLSTTQSILLALDNKPAIKHLRETRAYEKLTSYLTDAIKWSFLLVMVGLFGLFFEPKETLTFYMFCYYIIWLFVLLRMGFSCYRVVRLFNIILKY